ncbi:hypothetical protein FVE85_2385 [Porphyridium purpureum]|uniref:Uncharacterized protein n=1 Tax=Porphyridium purpureum TaxID=35688 RepID=A0A5J4YZ20_PORPP|nr:hypothetical protein FVE85_2385 [Porphyridium purpureum]|eukprot:POR0959..scf209_3
MKSMMSTDSVTYVVNENFNFPPPSPTSPTSPPRSPTLKRIISAPSLREFGKAVGRKLTRKDAVFKNESPENDAFPSPLSSPASPRGEIIKRVMSSPGRFGKVTSQASQSKAIFRFDSEEEKPANDFLVDQARHRASEDSIHPQGTSTSSGHEQNQPDVSGNKQRVRRPFARNANRPYSKSFFSLSATHKSPVFYV